ncbi:hypothetical protein NL676_011050 [Syzygium grande]|nr:hypothetical protein NL676_011050 [Syzygium grande]
MKQIQVKQQSASGGGGGEEGRRSCSSIIAKLASRTGTSGGSMGGPSQRQSSASSSRLSPLAEPFKLSKPYQQQVYTHSSEPTINNWQSLSPSVVLVHSFSSLGLESDAPGDCSYSVSDFGTKVSGFPYDYQDYPSEASRDLVGYETVSVIESSLVNCGKEVSNLVCDGQMSGVEDEGTQDKKGSSIGCQGSIVVEGKNASDSTAYPLFAKQGNNASKGSKSFHETCNDLYASPQFESHKEKRADSPFPVVLGLSTEGRTIVHWKCTFLLMTRDSALEGEERKSQRFDTVMNVESLPGVQCKRKVAEGSNFAQDSLSMPEKDGLNQNELDESDADEDSPCWKGLNFSQCAFRESEASEHQLDEAPDRKLQENRSEARKSLNPLAPVFVPQNIELKLCHKEIECAQNDSLPFQKRASSAPIPLSEVQTMQYDNMARHLNWEGPKTIGPQFRNDMHNPAPEPLLKGQTSSFAKVDSGVTSPFPREDFVTHTGDIGRGTNLEVPVNIINDIILPDATGVSVSAVVHVSESKSLEQWSFLGVGVPTYTEAPSDVSELVSTSSRTEVDVLLKEMHSLSELLIDKCENGYVLSDVIHDRIQVVISNLSRCTKQRERQWTSLDGSNIPGILSFSDKSAYACMNTDSVLSNKELQDGHPLVSNISNGIPQFIEKSMEAGLVEDQMSPQTIHRSEHLSFASWLKLDFSGDRAVLSR